MSDYAFILLGAVLVNNLVLAQFLGFCPVTGISRGLRVAMIVGLAAGFLLTLSGAVNHCVYEYLLRPLGLDHLRIPAFVLVIAALALLTHWTTSKVTALLDNVPAGLPLLIALNSAMLGVPLLNVQASRGFVESTLYALGGALGIYLVLILFAALRDRIAAAEVPQTFKGHAIDLITLGLMSLAFMGFAGLAR